ncbi:MAG: PDZ domain-containing protein [Alphaproteobacteria bacterium]
MRVTEDLAAHGRVIRGKSGLRVEDLDDHERATLIGARVTRATGPAEAAGLAPGDIITIIAGRPIQNASDITSALHLHRPGDDIAVRFSRDGEGHDTTLRLAP